MKLRILNAVVWIWLCMSNALMPVASQGSDFWFSKAMQLFELNRYLSSDLTKFATRSIIPVVLWFVIDRWLSWRNPRRGI